MFIFVLVIISSYFILLERYKASLLVMLPAFCIYFLVAGLQYDVGTDYFSYIAIFEDQARWQYYFQKKEYLFYWLNVALNWFSLPSQSIFIAIALIQSLLVFIYFKKIKKQGFILWLFFIVFFCVSNIYNNQLNGLRQYVVIAATPLLTIFLFEKRYVYFLIGVSLASFFHNTAWFLCVLVPIYFLQHNIDKRLFLIFVISAIAYLLLGRVVEDVANVLLQSYMYYLEGELAEDRSLAAFATKLFYLPLIFYFYYIYRKEETVFGKYLHFMIVIFTLTYWFFLLALYLGIATRLYYYVVFFYIFPVYYLLHRSYKKGKTLEFVLIMLYIVIPYLAKVTFLAKAEFLYQSILFY